MGRFEYLVKFRRQELPDQRVQADLYDWDEDVVTFTAFDSSPGTPICVLSVNSDEVLLVKKISED